MNSLLWF